jgi:hypothetical protein
MSKNAVRMIMHSCHHTVTRMSDSRRGFGLEIEFVDQFNTQFVTTFNYSANADFHILQITRAHKLVFSV